MISAPFAPRRRFLVPFLAFLAFAASANALQVTGYSAAKNNRFASGYATAPVSNTDTSFIGLGYDFSGVGWASNDPTKSFVLLSPKNFLATVHYGGANTLNFQGGDGQIYSYSQQGSPQATNYGVVFQGQTTGDIAIGTLTTAVTPSTGIEPYAILDLPSFNAYDGKSILLYGRGLNGSSSPRIGTTTINGGYIGGTYNSYLLTSRDDVQLETGDSGSPSFITWTDPTGAKQLTVVGNNAGTDTTNGENYLNFLGRTENISATNKIMAGSGYALRFVADATTSWKGTAVNPASYGTLGNWTSGVPTSASYLGFDSNAASSLAVDLGGASRSARGLIFNPGDAGFTFSNGTFNLGRGGINNYDTHLQTFGTGVNFSLTESQYWDGRSGGLEVGGNIDNGGYLLIVQGAAASRLSGVVSGTGGLAKDGSGSLALTNSNTYTGTTFLHNGTLLANNATGSATGTGSVSVEAGTLAGFGRIAGNTVIAAGARLTAGDITSGSRPTLNTVSQAGNRLTFGGNLTLHGELAFYLGDYSETAGFTQISLDGDTALLTLGANASFTLSSANFIGIDDPDSGQAFWNTSHSWTLVDITGSQQISGDFAFVDLGVWSQGYFTLITDGNTGNDLQLLYTAVPEPSAWGLMAGALGALLLFGATRSGRHVRRKRELEPEQESPA